MGQAEKVLRQYFGYDTFRKGQEICVSAILHGQDVIAIMPTGAGKSICYQLPAAMLDGVTIIISPLISLMKDQVDTLNQIGIATTFINSTLSTAEVAQRYRAIIAGDYKMVYVAPERLDSEWFVDLLRSIKIPLIAVDEAHCVSQWGHDFRPSYMNVSRMVARVEPRPVVAAFTATATDQVKTDIVRHLQLIEPERIMTGYARDNLSFTVLKGTDRRSYLVDYLRNRSGQSGIIYASTRKEVEDCHAYLEKAGFKAGRYHAGLGDQERAEAQDQFLYDDIQVMVATNAFGMGIDKSNVRFVIHYNMPKNLESYYQEAGRAGRDGEPGECILLFSPQDIMTQKFLIEQSESDETRRKMDYSNLNDMIDYCHTTECLQRYIVQYFGEDGAGECGQCSNCTDEREIVDITVEAQKIFSCIVRMKQRFGVTMTAKVLRGARDQKVIQFGFDRLPTYGVMNNYKEKDIVNMMNILIADRYLQLSDSSFPVVSLTERARDVLTGREKVYQRVIAIKKSTTLNMTPEQESMFEKLRSLRKQFSDREKVPPFTIFHDATLREMAAQRPQNEQELLAIKGVGKHKLQKYGKAFLECIRETM